MSRGRLVTAGASRLNSEDPFYWRFLEFGWNPNGGKGRSLRKKAAHRRVSGSKIPGGKFLTDSVKKFPQVVEVFKTQVGRWLDKLNDGGKVQP